MAQQPLLPHCTYVIVWVPCFSGIDSALGCLLTVFLLTLCFRSVNNTGVYFSSVQPWIRAGDVPPPGGWFQLRKQHSDWPDGDCRGHSDRDCDQSGAAEEEAVRHHQSRHCGGELMVTWRSIIHSNRLDRLSQSLQGQAGSKESLVLLEFIYISLYQIFHEYTWPLQGLLSVTFFENRSFR